MAWATALVLALRLGVVAAHQALQVGEFADHFGEQVGLAQLRGALGLGDVGADDGRELGGKRHDAGDALGLRAELLVEHDLLELRQPVFQPRLQVGVVEELGVGQPRADDALVAGDDRLAAVGGFFVGDQNEAVDQLGGLRIAQHEAFLVGADGGADHLVGDRQEGLVERAHQRHRPFHQTGDLRQQALVLDQFEALREGEVLGVGEDDLGAARGIEHHLGGLQLGDIVVEAAHLERVRRHEAMAARLVAGLDAVDVEMARCRAPRFPGRRWRRWNAAAAPRSEPGADRPSASTSARGSRAPPPGSSRRSPRCAGRPGFSITAT